MKGAGRFGMELALGAVGTAVHSIARGVKASTAVLGLVAAWPDLQSTTRICATHAATWNLTSVLAVLFRSGPPEPSPSPASITSRFPTIRPEPPGSRPMRLR